MFCKPDAFLTPACRNTLFCIHCDSWGGRGVTIFCVDFPMLVQHLYFHTYLFIYLLLFIDVFCSWMTNACCWLVLQEIWHLQCGRHTAKSKSRAQSCRTWTATLTSSSTCSACANFNRIVCRPCSNTVSEHQEGYSACKSLAPTITKCFSRETCWVFGLTRGNWLHFCGQTVTVIA